jgi:succinate dehydrogenase/fumarate reductase flavoprotein subunit
VGKSGTGLGQQTANGSIFTNYTEDYKSNYGKYISPVTTRAMMFEVDSGSNGSIFISFYEMAKLIQEKKGSLDISKYKQSTIREIAERYNGHPDHKTSYGQFVAGSELWKILK